MKIIRNRLTLRTLPPRGIKTVMKIVFVFYLWMALTPASAQNQNDRLLRAAFHGDKKEVIKCLRNGANVNYVKSEGPSQEINPLIASINTMHFEVARILVEHHADVNWKDGFNTSPIMYAAYAGDEELLKFLWAHGAELNDDDGQGNTVLTAARESKNVHLIKFVRSKLDSIRHLK